MTYYNDLPANYFFTFFFTHLQQRVDIEGINKWIAFVHESPTNHSVEGKSNSLFLRMASSLIGDYQNTAQVDWAVATQTDNPAPLLEDTGEIELTLEDTEHTLDASSDALVSINDIKADATSQPGYSYSLLWDTPVFEGRVKETSDFVWVGDEVERTYPYMIGGGQITPWFLESNTIEATNSSSDEIIWVGLTADSTQKNSLTSIEDAYGSTVTFTADRIDYYIYDIINSEDLDTLPEQIPPPLIKIDSLPIVNKIAYLTYKENDEVLSKTWRWWNGRGYLPSAQIGDVMKSASLLDIAWGILGLINSNEDTLLYLALAELSYIWAEFLENIIYVDGEAIENPNAVIGFPSHLPRIMQQVPATCHLPSDRDLYQNIWLGIALIEAAKYFRNRPEQKRFTLPPFYERMIKQLGRLVARSIDPISAYTISGYTEDGYSYETYSYPATVLSSVFLSSLLSLSYDEQTHFRAARSYLLVDNIEQVSDFPDYENISVDDQLNTHVSYLFWLACFNKSDQLCSDAVDNYKSLFLINPIVNHIEVTALGYFITNFLKQKDKLTENYSISNWNSSLFKKYDAGVYGIVRPDITCSASSLLVESNNIKIFSDPPFNLYAEAAEAATLLSLQNQQRLWPNGYKWPAQDILKPGGGEIGNTLYASTSQLFENELLTAMVKDSGSHWQSQGILLDVWASVAGLTRPFLMSDNYLRSLIDENLNNNRSTKTAIFSYLSNIYQVSATLIEPTLPPIIYIKPDSDVMVFEPVDTYDLTAAFQAIKAYDSLGRDISGYYLFDGTSYVFQSWYDLAARVTLLIRDVVPTKKTISELKSAGINLKLIILFSFFERNKVGTKFI